MARTKERKRNGVMLRLNAEMERMLAFVTVDERRSRMLRDEQDRYTQQDHIRKLIEDDFGFREAMAGGITVVIPTAT